MFPHFANLMPAFIAAAIAVPLLLLLYFLKLRRREIAVSSTILWRKTIQDLQVNAPFQRLKRNLLLFLQLLLLLLLILALSRPILNYSQKPGRLTVILLDRSASMSATDGQGGVTRLEEAKKRAKVLMDSLGRNDSAMVIAFDEAAETIQPFTSDTVALKLAIDSVQPTDCGTKLKDAYKLADSNSAFIPGKARSNQEPTEVFLFSDGRVEDVNNVSLKGNLTFERVGTDKAANIAIVALSAKRNFDRPTEVQVFTRLANFGPDPVRDVHVDLIVNGHVEKTAAVNLLPERWSEEQRRQSLHDGFPLQDSIEFPALELTTSALIQVRQTGVEGGAEALTADDSASLVVPPPKILSVLLVTDGNVFLSLGLKAQRLKTFDETSEPRFREMTSDEAGVRKTLQKYDVIVFDRCAPKTALPAGSFVYFGACPGGLSLKQETDATGKPVVVADNFVLDWQRDHPILKHMNLGKLYAADSIKLVPTIDSKVLIDGVNGPMLVWQAKGRAVHLVASFDVIHSNWPLKPSFPVFLYQMLQYLALGTELEMKQSYPPGSTVSVPRTNLQRLGTSPDTVTLISPDDSKQTMPVPKTGDFVLPAMKKVGIYRTDPAIPGYESIAVNLLDANESNLVPVEKVPVGEGAMVAVGAGKANLELWWWLIAVAALPLLIIEWWVYTRRVM